MFRCEKSLILISAIRPNNFYLITNARKLYNLIHNAHMFERYNLS